MGPEETFVCVHCGRIVPAAAAGTKHRNHCPYCLWSRHVDVVTGDRRSGCRAAMEPIAVSVRADGEWSVLHRCRGCGLIRANRIAGDDGPLVLMSLAARPLARPPFPLERLEAEAAHGE
ncbi:MAG: RNHCP domain-containing protein [Planctomycetes bacterium]|nr:RNHCP domain-containing protein [Planctomycetota bacterium]